MVAQEEGSDLYFMSAALDEARKAYAADEVPIGAVLVRDGEVVATGWNAPIQASDPTAHAEVVAMRKASKESGNYRLPNTTLYVTVEPCLMCVGAIIHARISKVVFGAREPRAGALVSHPYNSQRDCWNHRFDVVGGVLADACGGLMKEFFQKKRK